MGRASEGKDAAAAIRTAAAMMTRRRTLMKGGIGDSIFWIFGFWGMIS